jgi:hypothetical protein
MREPKQRSLEWKDVVEEIFQDPKIDSKGNGGPVGRAHDAARGRSLV